MESLSLSSDILEQSEETGVTSVPFNKGSLSRWNFEGAELIDLSNHTKSYLVEGDNQSSVKLSSSAFILLKHVSKGLSLESFAAAATQATGVSTTASTLEKRVLDLLRTLDHLYEASPASRLPRFFWFRLTVLPERYVCLIASKLAPAFSPVAIVLSSLATFECWRALHDHRLSHSTPFDGFFAFLVLLFCLLVHEFGHAAACARFQVKSREIGFSIYLIYPVFYTDVTKAWALSRLRRMIVDSGGCLFQLYAVGILSWYYLASHNSCIRIALYANLYSMLCMLNPIFKFDGYWLVADALGIHQLSRKPREAIMRLLTRSKQDVAIRSHSKPITIILIGYSFLSATVWTAFTILLVPRVYRLSLQVWGNLTDIAMRFHEKSVLSSGEMLVLLYKFILLFTIFLTILAVIRQIVSFCRDLLTN